MTATCFYRRAAEGTNRDKSDYTANYLVTKAVVVDSLGGLMPVFGKGNETKLFQVCSRAVSRSPPVFKDRLYGNEIEDQEKKHLSSLVWHLFLPEDKLDPMRLIFHAVRSPYTLFELTDQLGHEVLITTDKYDMRCAPTYHSEKFRKFAGHDTFLTWA